jgi:hypothetical protein
LNIRTIPASTFLQHDKFGRRVGVVVVCDGAIACLVVVALEEEECCEEGEEGADDEAESYISAGKVDRKGSAYAPMATPATAPLLKSIPLLEDDAAIGGSDTSAGFSLGVDVATILVMVSCEMAVSVLLELANPPISTLLCTGPVPGAITAGAVAGSVGANPVLVGASIPVDAGVISVEDSRGPPKPCCLFSNMILE